MSKSLTPQDAYLIMNLLVKEATGQNATIQAVDASTFVSAGETVLATGTENVLNALSRVIGRTMVAARPYNAKLSLINAINSGIFSERIRKISFYSKNAQASGDFNTNLYTQHGAGLDNGTNRIVNGSISPVGGLPNMWEQNPSVPLELNFSGHDVWDMSQTYYENQLQMAFRDESSFAQYVGGKMTEFENDLESQKEAFNRLAILNHIAGVIDMNQTGAVIDLKTGFNTKFGTEYTSAQLLSTYLEDFLKYFVSVYKVTSDMLTERTARYHWSPSKTVNGVSYTLLRHTPKNRQRALLYAPLFTDAEAQVMSGIFNPQYLDVGKYEKVMYWQNSNDPSAIDVVPAIPNTDNPASQKAGSRVQLDNVIGMIYDVDSLMIDYQLDSASTTPVESRKMYRNVWYHISKNIISDLTENAVVFILGNDA